MMNVLTKGGFLPPVKTEDWKPKHEQFDYPQEFVDWINSINSGWQNKKEYEPFNLYVRQANEWLMDSTKIDDYDNEEDQLHWLIEEIERCKENTLYFCNKYGRIKEDTAEGGSIPYIAWEPQQVLLFLFDCGYSMMIGKARQVGFTTTLTLAGMKRVNLNKSYFAKFITHSDSKGKEIFDDKVKWAFTKIPEYIARDVKNWTQNTMAFDRKGNRKGRDDGAGSKFQVVPPAVDAINGGSPSLVMVDEIGLFAIFGQMMREGRPALLKYNPKTGKLFMQQQFLAWGTGGEMDKGGAVFEQEFKACMKEWRSGNYEYGIIPLFFNAYARPGVTKEYLDKEIRAYVMNQESQNADVAKVQFYQAYPIVIEHMFLRKARTMIPISTCIEHGERIYTEDKITWGYFEPILDYSQPKPDLFVPYRIIGAKFVPTRDEFDVNTTVCIRTHLAKGEVWKWRFFQGTDPINSETGHSKMSSTVWDALTNSIAATVFTRDRNFKNSYLQCLLLRLYYDAKGTEGIPELIENNIGDMYLDFQEQLGFKRNIVSNMSLSPEYFRKPNGKWFGLANKVDTAPRILGKMQEMVDCHATNLDIPWLWKQFETFVEKDLSSASTHRQTRYQAADMRYDYDDVLFSTTFAYINAMSHAKYEPTNLNDDSLQRKVFTRRVQNRQTNFIPKMAEVDEKGNIIRIL
jgi:hypothetical protein